MKKYIFSITLQGPVRSMHNIRGAQSNKNHNAPIYFFGLLVGICPSQCQVSPIKVVQMKNYTLEITPSAQRRDNIQPYKGKKTSDNYPNSKHILFFWQNHSMITAKIMGVFLALCPFYANYWHSLKLKDCFLIFKFNFYPLLLGILCTMIGRFQPKGQK